MKKNFEYFGRYILSERLRHKLSQEKLGKLIGVHSQFVSNCERGICALPPKNLRVMHKELGLSKVHLQIAMNKDSDAKNIEFIKSVCK